MALIKCKECGKEISDQATTCPNCGYPMHQKITGNTNINEKIDNKKAIFIIIAIFVFALIIGAIIVVNDGQIPLFIVEGQGTVTIE